MNLSWFKKYVASLPSEATSDYYKVYNHIFFEMQEGIDALQKEVDNFRDIKVTDHEMDLDLTGQEINEFLIDEQYSDDLYDVYYAINYVVGDGELKYHHTYRLDAIYFDREPWDLCQKEKLRSVMESNLESISKKYKLTLSRGWANCRFKNREERERLLKCSFDWWMMEVFNALVDKEVPSWKQDLNTKIKTYIKEKDIAGKRDMLLAEAVKKHVVTFLLKSSKYIDNEAIVEAHKEFLAAQILKS